MSRYSFTGVLLSLAVAVTGCGGGKDQSAESQRKPLATAPSSASYNRDDLYRFFVVAFGAAPGVTYMGQAVAAADSGASVRQIVNAFTTKSQFLDTYPASLSDLAFAEKLTENVVGASATAVAKNEAVQDITNALKLPGMTRGDIVYIVFNNLANMPAVDPKWGKTAVKMANQVEYAKYYTDTLRGDTDQLATLRDVVATVTAQSGTAVADIRSFLFGRAQVSSTLTVPPFQSAAIVTPDIEPLYKEICGPETVGRGLQHVVPVDLNADARMDLLLYLWCQPVPAAGQYFDGPTPSRIVALLQNQQGQFENKTAEIFGSDRPSIGAASDCFVVHDFNNDGKLDIVYSAKREDGRQAAPPTSINDARAAALMSSGTSRYNIEFIGSPQWGECVYLLDNARNGKDIFLTGVGNSQWTYQNGWKLAQDMSSFAQSVGTMFFDRKQSGSPSTEMIGPLGGNPDNFGIYFHRWADGEWRPNWQDGFKIPGKSIQWTNGREVLSGFMVTLDSRDLIWPSFGQSCQIRRSPTATPEALVAFNGIEIVGGYRGQTVEPWGPAVIFLNLFGTDVSGKLEKRTLTIRNEKTHDTSPNRMRCYDINGDGFEDIVLYSTNIRNSNDVLVYLNDRAGGFYRVDPVAFPSSPNGFGQLRNYTFADINGDGIEDLIYFQIVGETGKENTLRIHLGTRPLQARDQL